MAVRGGKRAGMLAGATVSVILVLLGSCTRASGTDASNTRDRARGLGLRMVNSDASTTRELAGIAEAFGDDVMVAEDTDAGPLLIVRIVETEEFSNGSTRNWTACWEYLFDGRGDTDLPEHVPRPEGDPATLAPTTTTTRPRLADGPDGALLHLTAATEPLTPGEWADAALVEEVVRQAFAHDPKAAVDVARRKGTGVAVGVGSQCVMARSEPLEAWVVPWQVIRPGEGSCDAVTASSGGLKHTPH